MAVETFLIRLREDASAVDARKVVAAVRNVGGRVEAVLKDGAVIIASLESGYSDALRSLPPVALVGGVVFRGREIRRARVRSTD